MICRETTLSDASCVALPSLALAVWMTNLLLTYFSDADNDMDKKSEIKLISRSIEEQNWIIQLVKCWSFSLRSPSLPVKTCAVRMLCAIVATITIRTVSNVLEIEFLSRVMDEIPLVRLRLMSQVRLAKEKGSLPVCSEFLQVLLELVAVVTPYHSDTVLLKVDDTEPHSVVVSSSSTSSNSAVAEEDMIVDDDIDEDEDEETTENVTNENWEALSGRLFSDEGWETWTGHVHQSGVTDLPAAVQRLQERQDLPPELMPGCKVCRKRVQVVPMRDVGTPTTSGTSNSNGDGDDITQSSLTGSLPSIVTPSRRILSDSMKGDDYEAGKVSVSLLEELGPPISSSSRGSREESEDQIGTVVGVAAWGDEPLGSARIVKWDDEVDSEIMRWDAEDGNFDMTHVKIKNGKITTRFPHPQPRLIKIANRYFGPELTFGVILRVKADDLTENEDPNIIGRFHGVMEWPDFAGITSVSGVVMSDGSRTFTEEALLSGPSHTGWDTRFAHSWWRAGTTYSIAPPSTSNSSSSSSEYSAPGVPSSSCQSDLDAADPRNGELHGTYNYEVQVAEKLIKVSGALYLQQSRLFIFDEKNSYYNITVSSDKMTVAKNGGSGQACAFGSVGFSSGIHYWEFKIEQADVGSIFLGVAEKPGAIGSSQTSRFGRWVGSGLANHRASFRSSSRNTGDRLSVYGDHFHTGDTVGVLLDMNRGRISFYLDGLKYGQHTIADLGEAFDGLTMPGQVRRRTLFPIVGLSKSQDRIAITPRWLSSIGTSQAEEVHLVGRAHQLLEAWSAASLSVPSNPARSGGSSDCDSTSPLSTESIVLPSQIPDNTGNILFDKSSWLFKEAYGDWKRWKSARFIRVRSRCQAAGILVAVDVTPRACVEACIRLGLPTALLRGDRVLFSRSSGRKLDTKEEAVILGAYKGQLWYRLDSQQGHADGGIMESAAIAWSLVASDVEGLTLLRRSYALPISEKSPLTAINIDNVDGFSQDTNSSFGEGTSSTEESDDDFSRRALAELHLPRIPSFQGGLVLVTYANGAVMRDGLEIDTSEVLCSVPADTVVYALEQRLNSSNVWRLRVIYGGHYGWISERMRGGSEEFMLKKVRDATPEALETAIQAAVVASEALNIIDRVRWDLQPTIAAAMERWDDMVVSIGRADVLAAGEEPEGSLEYFCDLAATTDGTTPWTVEADMQLADFISQCAAKEGSTPQNVSVDRVVQTIRSSSASGGISLIDGSGGMLPGGSLLCGIFPERVVARASLLRIANLTLRYALPYLNMILPEEKQRRDCFGSDDAVDIDATPIPAKKGEIASTSAHPTPPLLNAPPCTARRLRALRRLLFGQTKTRYN